MKLLLGNPGKPDGWTPPPEVWQYRLWCFQMGGTKLERFLPMNQRASRKLLNFEFWINVEKRQNLTFEVNFVCEKSFESF